MLISDPTWPWARPVIGLAALAGVALLLVGLTVWAYAGVQGMTLRRILTALALRLGALALVFVLVLRPSFASRDELRPPSLLYVVVDSSASMSIQDEFKGRSRWEYLQQTLNECEPALERLREQRNVHVAFYRFAEDLGDYDPRQQPDGQRTDFGQMLQSLYERPRQERYLSGLVILSDGANNGTRFPALSLAAQWRGLPCPVHTVGFGNPAQGRRPSDIVVVRVTPEPSPVPVKGDLTVKGLIDAPGFAGSRVRVQLLLDDKPVAAEEKLLPLDAGNEVSLKCPAPAEPGEVKVTFKVDPLPDELLRSNNEMSTYVTVTRGGLSVLLVDSERFPEPQLLCDALRLDPRISLHTAWLRGLARPSGVGNDLFHFDRERYDVVILGDLTADRLHAADPQAVTRLHEMVRDKGAGLLVIGGDDSFGSSWQNTPIATMLPVELAGPGRLEGPIKMMPTEAGLRHFVMQLADRKADTLAAWKSLRPLDGMNRLGKPKLLNNVLAESSNRVPLLVGQDYGSGRTMAFAGDTTYLWRRTPEGVEQHVRFWRQVVLWLARQEKTEGSVWIRPDARRAAAGDKLGFSVGLRGKTGVELTEARFEAKVIGPRDPGNGTLVPTARDRGDERGTLWKTSVPGEYRIVVNAKGKDLDGEELNRSATARFLVYQDDAEMGRREADHEFLRKLAAAGGGRFLEPSELARFLQALAEQPLPLGGHRAMAWPNWKRAPRPGSTPSEQASAALGSGMMPCMALFITLVGAEWFLRRRWGMV